MGERANLVFSQTLSNASLEKITLGQDVLSSKLHLFPENFVTEKRADLTLLNDVNEESEKAPQLVLLQEGWKPVVEKLHLKEGDTVSIFLFDRDTSTYSIQVERAAAGVEADQGDADREEVIERAAAGLEADQGDADREEVITAAKVLISMGTPGLQLLADCALEQQDDLCSI